VNDDRPPWAFVDRLPEGKIIHRRVEPVDRTEKTDAEMMRQLRELFAEHPGHSVYIRQLDDERIEMIVVEGAFEG
jgi:hypothetical protein